MESYLAAVLLKQGSPGRVLWAGPWAWGPCGKAPGRQEGPGGCRCGPPGLDRSRLGAAATGRASAS